MNRPIRTTVVFAFASGLTAVPGAYLLSSYLPWETALKLMLWLDMAIYAILLARWSGRPLLPVLFPLTILLGTAMWPPVFSGFFILSLGIFAWVRSGICFQGAPIRAVTAEVVTIGLGAALVLLLHGNTPVALALNLCLFLLVQTLYFFLVPLPHNEFKASVTRDPFERAVEAANKILDGI